MKTVLVEVSGESLPLARAEALAAAEAIGGRRGPDRPEWGPTLVAVDLPDDRSGRELAGRLALARRCLELRAEPGALPAAWTVLAQGAGTAAVRRLGRPSSGGADPGVLEAGRGFTRAGGSIDLERPDHRFWLVGAGPGRDALFEEVGAVDRPAASARRMPTLPFQRPVALPPRLARAAANLARIRPGDRVVDPFVGTGALLAEAGLLGARLYGIDRDPAMVRGTLRNLRHLNVTADELVVGDAGSAEFADPTGSFDALLTDPPYGRASSTGGEGATEVLERVLPRWAARVRPGGRLVLIVPGARAVLGADWEERLRVPIRVHRSLTREFHVYERAGVTATSRRTSG